MNIYLIIDRKLVIGDGKPIVKHEIIEGWIELDGEVMYQCIAEESSPKTAIKTPMLRQLPGKQWICISDHTVYDKVQFVPED